MSSSIQKLGFIFIFPFFTPLGELVGRGRFPSEPWAFDNPSQILWPLPLRLLLMDFLSSRDLLSLAGALDYLVVSLEVSHLVLR